MLIEYKNGSNVSAVNPGECIEYAGNIYMRIDNPNEVGYGYTFVSLSDGKLHWFSEYGDRVSIVNAKVIVDGREGCAEDEH